MSFEMASPLGHHSFIFILLPWPYSIWLFKYYSVLLLLLEEISPQWIPHTMFSLYWIILLPSMGCLAWLCSLHMVTIIWWLWVLRGHLLPQAPRKVGGLRHRNKNSTDQGSLGLPGSSSIRSEQHEPFLYLQTRHVASQHSCSISNNQAMTEWFYRGPCQYPSS